jgi:predicted aconitase with swiveling domain
MRFEGTALNPGRANGAPLVLTEPLSFWGGVDPASGAIIDVHHPQVGAATSGRILVLPSGRGSSSSSSVLAEILRRGVGPAAILLGAADPIIALGALVANELYGQATPVVVLDPRAYRACAAASEIDVEAHDRFAAVTVPGP